MLAPLLAPVGKGACSSGSLLSRSEQNRGPERRKQGSREEEAEEQRGGTKAWGSGRESYQC
jgi:hypothetical protein